MAHAEHAPRALAHDCECLGQDVIKRLALCEPLAELVRLARELGVREPLHLRLKRIDLLDDLLIGRDVLVVVVTQESFQKTQQMYPLLEGIYFMAFLFRLRCKIHLLILSDTFIEVNKSRKGGCTWCAVLCKALFLLRFRNEYDKILIHLV